MIHEESGFSLKILWHPKKGEIITTEHPRTLSFKAADKYRATALKLLQEVEKRGRPNGPAGFKDAQAFEDTVVHLIQTAHAKGQGTQQERIAELLRPVLVSRRAGIGSAASVDVTAKSTARLIHMHTSCSWRALVKKALQPL
jgi:hypothetical protein